MLRRIKNIRKKPVSPSATAIVVTRMAGVLTKNQPVVQETWRLPEHTPDLAEVARRAVSPTTHDPLDAALAAFAKEKGIREPSHPPMRDIPFSPTAGMSGSLWHNGSEYILAAKGAPEHVLERCGLTEDERERATAQLHQLAANGYRVIALARRPLSRPINSFDDLTKKDTLEFAGLLAIADTAQAGARLAVKAAASLGTAVYIVTGEHPETAYYLGRELGIARHRRQLFDARHLEVTSDEELEKVLGEARIFARAAPEQRQRIVALLEKRGAVVMPSNLEELRHYAVTR